MAMGDFKRLVVWEKAMILARLIYAITRKLPDTENFGLRSQMQRSAISIPSNIAEGSKRGSGKEFAHFLRIAHGSLAELETQLFLLKDLYPTIEISHAFQVSNEVGRMLFVMSKRLS